MHGVLCSSACAAAAFPGIHDAGELSLRRQIQQTADSISHARLLSIVGECLSDGLSGRFEYLADKR